MLRTFGGLELMGSKVTRQRPLLLLAYLVGEGGRMERQTLAKAFYSPLVDESDNLTTDLRRLREGLPDCVRVDGGHVETNVSSDYQEFRELLQSNRVTEALERYRGPFLHGFRLPTRRGRESAVSHKVQLWIGGVRRESADAALAPLLLLIRQALDNRQMTEATRFAERASEIVWDAQASQDAIGLIQLALQAGKSSRSEDFAQEARAYAVHLPIEEPSLAASGAAPTDSNLPTRLTSFVGRRRELLDLAQRVRQRSTRILTVTGVGGIGKSRLALEVARSAEQEGLHQDGVVHLALADVKFAGLVPIRIAEALRLDLKLEEDAWRQVCRALKRKRLLLVLDDIDQLQEIGPDLEATVRECQGLDVIITSRQPLGIEGEATYRLKPLLVTAENGAVEASEDAIDLFVARASEVDPSFTLTAENRGTVGQVCALAEGSPLAIEWAAASLSSLSLEAIAGELGHSQDALGDRSTRFPGRHRSPAALFESSWQRLSPRGKGALAALSIFRDGFSRRAAMSVASVGTTTLAELASASLIDRISEERYSFQPLVRQQATKQLKSRPELHATVEAEFRTYYLWFVRTLREAVGSRRIGAASAELDLELRSVRQAWRLEDEALALYDYTVCLAPYLERRGLWNDQFELATKALERGGDRPEAAPVHFTLATVHRNRGELPGAQRHLHAALELSADRSLRAEVLNALGGVHYQLRELDEAREHFMEAHALFEELGAGAQLTTTLNNLAAVEYQLGNLETGIAHWQDALRRQQLAGDTLQQSRTHNNIGMAYRVRGDLDQAAIHFEKALLLRRRAHDNLGGIVTEANIAGVRYEQGEFDAAAEIYHRLLAEHEAMGDRSGQALTLNDLAAIDEQLGRLDAARRRLIEAELIQEEIQDVTNLVTTLNNLALVELSASNERRAAVYADRAYSLAEATGNHSASVYSLTYMGAAKVLAGKPEESLELLERAMGVAKDLNFRSARIQALIWAARAQLAMLDGVRAELYAQEAVMMANELGHLPAERQAVRVLAEIEVSQERWRAAQASLTRLLKLDVQLKHPDLDTDEAWLREVTARASEREPNGGEAPARTGKVRP